MFVDPSNGEFLLTHFEQNTHDYNLTLGVHGLLGFNVGVLWHGLTLPDMNTITGILKNQLFPVARTRELARLCSLILDDIADITASYGSIIRSDIWRYGSIIHRSRPNDSGKEIGRIISVPILHHDQAVGWYSRKAGTMPESISVQIDDQTWSR